MRVVNATPRRSRREGSRRSTSRSGSTSRRPQRAAGRGGRRRCLPLRGSRRPAQDHVGLHRRLRSFGYAWTLREAADATSVELSRLALRPACPFSTVRAGLRPRCLPALRAVRAAAEARRRLACPLRGDLESPLEPAAPFRLDIGRRGRPADPASSPATTRSPAAASTTHSASPCSARAARVVLRALQEYGMMVAENGSDWFV